MRLAAVLLSVLLLPPHAMAAQPLQHLSGRTMGTTWNVTVASDADADRLQAGIQAQLDEVVAQMSTWETDSAISRFNRASAGSVHGLSDGFYTVVDAALALASNSDGAYDPTIGPLVNLWGFGPDGPREAPPGDDEIAAVRARTGWRRLVLDRRTRTLVQPGGLYLDLSSIAKGHGVDRVGDYLDTTGSRAWLVEVGGELRARGRKPDGAPWRIAVERPAPDDRDGDARPALSDTVVVLENMAMATSGDYRHFFEVGDDRYSHTIDPRTGRPVTHALASVTVLHPSGMQADALATALGVLGPDEGFDYASERGLAAMFIVRGKDRFESRMTPAFEARLQP